ncbi:MAG TPA: CsbD family protein [Nevskiaceae bacterium]|nr:CsbD family protein [Nevskiaceae bacterium]
MNTDMIKGRWKQWLGRAKHAWSTLTHDELLAAQSDMLRLSGLLQERCGEARAQAQRLLDGLDTHARTH